MNMDVDSITPNRPLDPPKSLSKNMEWVRSPVRDTPFESFRTSGLLSECDSQEETLVESGTYFMAKTLANDAERPARASRKLHCFKSNGLLDAIVDTGSTKEACQAIPSVQASADDVFSWKSTSLLAEESVEVNAELERIDESRMSRMLDGFGRQNGGSESQSSVDTSQDDLPSLTQMLRPNGWLRNEVPVNPHDSRSSLCATTFNGKTIVFRRKAKSKAQTVTTGHNYTKLLDVPVHKLKDQLSEIAIASLTKTDVGSSASTVLKQIDNELWVDRYRPSRFMDLLGDERVHRDTLAWLKEWDHCVFGKRKPLNRQNKTQSNDDLNAESRYEDVYYRPREKILLLAGPAGYGKTTLAHVVARQAGYEVMEINASDSRSGQVIDDRVRPTLESGQAVGSKKPVCLVIDEIDGATGAGENSSTFIHKLIGLTFDNAKKKGRRDKNKDTKRPLLRPIICICNDLYAASLTRLRQYTRIIRFTRPSDIHLTKRLRSICELEGLNADSRALTTLVGIAKGDIRGCLNTLQFVKARRQEVTEGVIRSATAGMKEADSSFASVMSSLFAPLPRRRVKELGINELEENRYVSRLSADVDATGSVDKVALGCFEHYVSLRHYEASLSRHEKGADWLVAFDSLSTAMRSEREYGLMPYLSYTIVPFYPLFNERGGAKVDRPKADWEAHMKMRTNEEIYKSLAKCVRSAGQRCTGLRHFLSNEIMQLELAPYINRIISPPMRPVNSQVTKPRERTLLARLVEIMLSLELHYIQEKAEDGQLTYRLEPPVDVFITYDGKRAQDVAVQRYATRHVIAGEIDAQLIARHAEVIDRSKATVFGMFKSRTGEDGTQEQDPSETGGKFQSRKRKVEALDIADKPPVDFFGRPIAVPTAPSSKRSKNSGSALGTARPPGKFIVSYRFNEGNSAAVRKSMKVSSFL